MHIQYLYLRNFRNYKEAEVSFAPKVNVIWGDNAQGKTNLLEALSLVTMGRSFRTQHLEELLHEGAASLYIEAHIMDTTQQIIRLTLDTDGNKRLQWNSSTYSSFTPLLGSFPCVVYAPSDAQCIDGSPSLRRRFMNIHLAQRDPLYVHHLARFLRAMKQRNALLKQKGKHAETEEPITCWEMQMAYSADFLYQKRRAFIAEFQPLFAAYSAKLSTHTEQHEIQYHPSAPENYVQQLAKNRAREKLLGVTLFGPHRDEISFWIAGKMARLFASEGQKKTATAALKLTEWDCLATRLGKTPIMAIDDLGVSLDQTRQTLFQKKLAQLGQVFITVPFPTLSLEAQQIHVEKGVFHSTASI